MLKTGGSIQSFGYDALGNMTIDAQSGLTITNMAYDLDDRLTEINASGTANDATFTLDALGRFRTRVIAAGTETYSYVESSETVARIAGPGGATTDSIVSPAGDRLGVRVGATVNWFLPDLHGSVAGSLDAAETIVVNAIRYDAWGQTISTGTAGGTRVGDKAWKYQGRLDVSPDGLATPLYDMSARFYMPGTGTFRQLDTYAGSAQDPLSMNRFLYAGANPTTLIDPTGHRFCEADCTDDPTEAEIAATRDAAVTNVQKATEKQKQKKQKEKQKQQQKQKSVPSARDNYYVDPPPLTNRQRLHLIYLWSRAHYGEVFPDGWQDETLCEIWGRTLFSTCALPSFDPSSDLAYALFGDPFVDPDVIFSGFSVGALRSLTGLTTTAIRGAVARGVPLPTLGGSYELKKESMSQAARAYQARVTGVAEGYVYRLGSAFDAEGIGKATANAGKRVLVNAKHLKSGSRLIEKKTGQFQKWFQTAKNDKQMIGEVLHANGRPIEYWVSSEEARVAWQGMVDRLGLSGHVSVIVVP